MAHPDCEEFGCYWKAMGGAQCQAHCRNDAKTDSRCNYLAAGLCNKCGREHDGKGEPLPKPKGRLK